MKNYLFILLWFSTSILIGQTNTSVFDLIADEDIIDFTLRTDIKQLLESVTEEEKYQPATVSFRSDERGMERWDIKVRVRGKFRRQACAFPPIMLNFSKSELKESGLAKHDKLKLVTHCAEDVAAGESHLLREYLAYKLYNIISPYSYRVQLVRMKYVDSNNNLSDITAYGFIIEDTDEVGDHIKSEECDDCKGVATTAFDVEASTVHAMFQYLIGNSDYSMPIQRNVKVYRRKIDNKLIPVGYDFDFSGFVEAPYAIPANHLGQLAVRQRIYLGTQRSDEVLLQAIDRFETKRSELLRVVNDFKLLPKTTRDKLEEYILIFYDQMKVIREGGENIYLQLRQEHPDAIPDGGEPRDFGLATRRN